MRSALNAQYEDETRKEEKEDVWHISNRQHQFSPHPLKLALLLLLYVIMLSLFKVLPLLLLLADFAVSFSVGPRANPLRYGTYTGTKVTSKVTQLSASLKPAAIPLMDSGKAFARSGEFIIDLTTAEGTAGSPQVLGTRRANVSL